MTTLDFSPTTGQLLDIIEFDADIQLGPGLPSDVTNYPVESGAILSDSIIRKPRTWQNTHRVTDTPTKTDIQPIATDGGRRTVQVWQRLLQAWRNRQTCRYIDDLDSVDAVAIVDVKAQRDADNQGALDLTIQYQEIIVATVQRAKITLKPHSGKRKNKGVVGPPVANAPAILNTKGQLLGWQLAQGNTVANGGLVDNGVLVLPTGPTAQELEATQTTAPPTPSGPARIPGEPDYGHVQPWGATFRGAL